MTSDIVLGALENVLLNQTLSRGFDRRVCHLWQCNAVSLASEQ